MDLDKVVGALKEQRARMTRPFPLLKDRGAVGAASVPQKQDPVQVVRVAT